MTAHTTTGTASTTGRRIAAHAPVLIGFGIAAVLLFLVAPTLLSQFRINLLAKYLCYGIVAIGIGLAWGRGGMLVMGQGVFFGLGAYPMAMYLKMADSPTGVPDFMSLYGSGELPGWWVPFSNPVVAVVATFAIPMIVAWALGMLVFKRRVKGAYFAILSQALAAAFAILLIGQQTTTGGSNGLNNFRSFFGYDLRDPANQLSLYFLAAGVLLAMVWIVRQIMQSRYGELLVAVRDQEERVRFLGYDPANVKTAAYVVAAGMAGIAGALFVPIVGIISPSDIGVVPSIGFLAGVALGGRSTLLGPVLGAIAVAWAQSTLSESFPAVWTYFQGLLFALVVTFLPGGLAQLFGLVRRRAVRRGNDAERSGAVRPAGDRETVEVVR